MTRVLPCAGLVLTVLCAGVVAPSTAQAPNRGRPARPVITLPDGPVRQIVLRSCSGCHGIDEYGYYAMGREDWRALVERMKTVRSGVVVGTEISDADLEVLLDWLVADFGPDAKPFPRTYVPRELAESEYIADAEANELLSAACTSCHGRDRVDTVRRSEDEWRATLVGKIGRGAPLALADVEPLVEWLGRTHGINPSN